MTLASAPIVPGLGVKGKSRKAQNITPPSEHFTRLSGEMQEKSKQEKALLYAQTYLNSDPLDSITRYARSFRYEYLLAAKVYGGLFQQRHFERADQAADIYEAVVAAVLKQCINPQILILGKTEEGVNTEIALLNQYKKPKYTFTIGENITIADSIGTIYQSEISFNLVVVDNVTGEYSQEDLSTIAQAFYKKAVPLLIHVASSDKIEFNSEYNRFIVEYGNIMFVHEFPSYTKLGGESPSAVLIGQPRTVQFIRNEGALMWWFVDGVNNAIVEGFLSELPNLPSIQNSSYIQILKKEADIIDARKIIIMNWNENPTPYTNGIMQALKNYFSKPPLYTPQSAEYELKILEGLARKYYNFSEKYLLFTRGGSEGIKRAISALSNPGDKILMGELVYPNYQTNASAYGLHIFRYRHALRNPEDITSLYLDVNGLIEQISEIKPHLLILINPGNPTGDVIEAEDFRKLMDHIKSASPETIVIVDAVGGDLYAIEAGYDYPKYEDYYKNYNLLVLNGLSKTFGITGPRCGVMLGNDKVMEQIVHVLPNHSISLYGTQAMLYAFQQPGLSELEKGPTFVRNQQQIILEQFKKWRNINKDFCYKEDVVGNFVLFAIKGVESKIIVDAIKNMGGVLVTKEKNSNLVRVSLGTAEENQLFLKSLENLLYKIKLISTDELEEGYFNEDSQAYNRLQDLFQPQYPGPLPGGENTTIIPVARDTEGDTYSTTEQRITTSQIGDFLQAKGDILVEDGRQRNWPQQVLDRINGMTVLDHMVVDLGTKDNLKKIFGLRIEDRPALIIMMLGRASPPKGIEKAMDVAKLVSTTIDGPVQLCLLGDVASEGFRKTLTEKSKKLGIHTEFLGPYRIHELPQIYSKVDPDIVFIPSIREGTPARMHEAMALGTPVIVTHVGGMKETLFDPRLNGFQGVVLDADERFVQNAADVILRMYENANTMRLLGQKGREFTEWYYSDEIIFGQWVGLLQHFLPQEKHNTFEISITSGGFGPYEEAGGAEVFPIKFLRYLGRTAEFSGSTTVIAQIDLGKKKPIAQSYVDDVFINKVFDIEKDFHEIAFYPKGYRAAADRPIAKAVSSSEEKLVFLENFRVFLEAIQATEIEGDRPLIRDEEVYIKAGKAIVGMHRFFKEHDYFETMTSEEVAQLIREEFPDYSERDLRTIFFHTYEKESLDNIFYTLQVLNADIPASDIGLALFSRIGRYLPIIHVVNKLEKGIPYVLWEGAMEGKLIDGFLSSGRYSQGESILARKIAFLITGLIYYYAGDGIVVHSSETKRDIEDWYDFTKRRKITYIANPVDVNFFKKDTSLSLRYTTGRSFNLRWEMGIKGAKEHLFVISIDGNLREVKIQSDENGMCVYHCENLEVGEHKIVISEKNTNSSDSASIDVRVLEGQDDGELPQRGYSQNTVQQFTATVPTDPTTSVGEIEAGLTETAQPLREAVEENTDSAKPIAEELNNSLTEEQKEYISKNKGTFSRILGPVLLAALLAGSDEVDFATKPESTHRTSTQLFQPPKRRNIFDNRRPGRSTTRRRALTDAASQSYALNIQDVGAGVIAAGDSLIWQDRDPELFAVLKEVLRKKTILPLNEVFTRAMGKIMKVEPAQHIPKNIIFIIPANMLTAQPGFNRAFFDMLPKEVPCKIVARNKDQRDFIMNQFGIPEGRVSIGMPAEGIKIECNLYTHTLTEPTSDTHIEFPAVAKEGELLDYYKLMQLANTILDLIGRQYTEVKNAQDVYDLIYTHTLSQPAFFHIGMPITQKLQRYWKAWKAFVAGV
ncbi:MAG: aminotransferase class I/II-fold pyridoxal phosphate-dependent enzyme [Candidatus Omnitrophica bacterium]|nr:aminotransferase class I/II-fold pyridoxal phosphate-dependent enzyme [Candidatus Omnitrophota bacterium]